MVTRVSSGPMFNGLRKLLTKSRAIEKSSSVMEPEPSIKMVRSNSMLAQLDSTSSSVRTRRVEVLMGVVVVVEVVVVVVVVVVLVLALTASLDPKIPLYSSKKL